MPLVQIDLDRALMEAKKALISERLQQAIVDALGSPPDDKFQIFRPHDDGELVADPGFWGVDRRSMVSVQVTLVHQYPVDTKLELYRQIASNLEEIGIRHEDVFISLLENGFEDWYPGKIPGD
jgi:Tautomerase enzyme